MRSTWPLLSLPLARPGALRWLLQEASAAKEEGEQRERGEEDVNGEKREVAETAGVAVGLGQVVVLRAVKEWLSRKARWRVRDRPERKHVVSRLSRPAKVQAVRATLKYPRRAAVKTGRGEEAVLGATLLPEVPPLKTGE